MIREDPNDLGYTVAHTCPYCGMWGGQHRVTCSAFTEDSELYEECPDCKGKGFWRHPHYGPEPCLTCFENGLVPHRCASDGTTMGAD